MNEQAIGEILTKKRKEQKLKIKKAAADLKIKQEYLEAVEEGRLSYISQHVYATGYIKSYAKWLGMSHEDITAMVKTGAAVDANVEELPPHQKNPITKAGSAITAPTKVGFGTLFSFLTPSSFSSSRQKTPDIKLVSVGGRVLLLSLLLAACVYAVWQYVDKNAPELLPENLPFISEKAHQYNGYHVDGTRKIVIFANQETVLKLFYPATETRMQRLLSVGEAYFLPEDTEVVISAEMPEEVELFAGKDGSDILGNLKLLTEQQQGK